MLVLKWQYQYLLGIRNKNMIDKPLSVTSPLLKENDQEFFEFISPIFYEIKSNILPEFTSIPYFSLSIKSKKSNISFNNKFL